MNWLQNYLLPCPFKYITGIDCPGCGFQRAVIALIKGNFHESFVLYPPTIPLLIFFAFSIADNIFKLDNQKNSFKKSGFLIVGSIILISYGLKIFGIYPYYTASVAAAI